MTRVKSVKLVFTSYEIILETLQEISTSNLNDRNTSTQSLALSKKISILGFIVSI